MSLGRNSRILSQDLRRDRSGTGTDRCMDLQHDNTNVYTGKTAKHTLMATVLHPETPFSSVHHIPCNFSLLSLLKGCRIGSSTPFLSFEVMWTRLSPTLTLQKPFPAAENPEEAEMCGGQQRVDPGESSPAEMTLFTGCVWCRCFSFGLQDLCIGFTQSLQRPGAGVLFTHGLTHTWSSSSSCGSPRSHIPARRDTTTPKSTWCPKLFFNVPSRLRSVFQASRKLRTSLRDAFPVLQTVSCTSITKARLQTPFDSIKIIGVIGTLLSQIGEITLHAVFIFSLQM